VVIAGVGACAVAALDGLSRDVLTGVIVAACGLGAVSELRRRFGEERWWLRAADRGVVAFILGFLILFAGSIYVSTASTRPLGFPPGAALAAALAYPLMVGGLLTLLRTPERNYDGLLEALLVSALVVFIAWTGLMSGDLHVPVEVLAFGLARPGLDLIVVLLAAHLHDSEVARIPAAPWLCITAGAGLRLGADVGLSLPRLLDVHVPPMAILAAILASLALLVAGTLHPSFAREPTASMSRPVRLNPIRLGIVMTAVLAGPLTLLWEFGHADRMTVEKLALGSVVLSGLAVAYLIQLVDDGARLEHSALHDHLTGLPNRVYFTEKVGAALSHARHGDDRVAVMFLDLDRFKTINDSLGHSAGNELLQLVGRRLRQAFRDEDTVSRLGGDEFTVLIRRVDDAAVTAAAERLQAAFIEPFALGGRELFVNPSVGVAIGPDNGEDVETLLRNADTAMYKAKAAGGRRHVLYTGSMNARAAERLALETSLHRAVDRDELVLHYQPKVDVKSGEIVGVEALVRWEHPELGLLPACDFIPLAEETGLIVPLGDWVLTEACTQMSEWRDIGHDLTVAVNLSVRQFRELEMSDVIASALRRSGLQPFALELELTEGIAVGNQPGIITTLEDISQMGVVCTIDDFGTGYSSLSYLTRLPIDVLKIDRSFVSRIEDEHEGRIVAAVIALAHQLGMKVVAEGVESPGQARFLDNYGCDTMQGYLLGHPVPAATLEKMLGRVRLLRVAGL
jgi:diguanylate cyclase (GGDEF)-like protein